MGSFTKTIQSSQSWEQFKSTTLPELLAQAAMWGYSVTSQTDSSVNMHRQRGGLAHLLWGSKHVLTLRYGSDEAGTRLIVSGDDPKAKSFFDRLDR